MPSTRSSARTCSIILLAASFLFAQADAFAARPDGKGKPNKAPTIQGTPSGVAGVEQFYAFQATARDRDGDTLKFTISNKPVWAAFDTARGYLSGYPGYTDAGRVTNNIVIGVSDGKSSASLPSFSIAVGAAPQNSPPVIGGTSAKEVIATETYGFRPTATDADGDTLSFTVVNRPSWASFNATTGRLYGTPGAADVGLYERIRISVTDGIASVSMSEFSVAVVQTTNGTATLSWLAPDANSDGTPLTDLAGYRIYYGSATGQYDHKLEITGSGTMTAVIDNLSPGGWYFAATALNSTGLESGLSNEVQKTVQ
jgi:hypothetical protein